MRNLSLLDCLRCLWLELNERTGSEGEEEEICSSEGEFMAREHRSFEIIVGYSREQAKDGVSWYSLYTRAIYSVISSVIWPFDRR